MDTEKKCSCESCKCNEEVASQPDRRTVLGLMVGLINLGLIATFVGPVLGFLGSPLKHKRKTQWVPLIDESELPVGTIKEVPFTIKVEDGYHTVNQNYTVFLSRTEEGVECYDPACTHLGCKVKYVDEHRTFNCPCHGGVFSDKGEVVSGPPPKRLITHPVELKDGKIWIEREV